MLLNSLVIVLREVLEAALILAALMAASRMRGQSLGWVLTAIIAGLAGAAFYGSNMDSVSQLFEGVGQELLNAALQFSAFFALVATAFLAVRNAVGSQRSMRMLTLAMIMAVALLITREGSEIFVFISGFVGTEDFLASTGAGAAIGAAIGFSVGALLFYLLLSQPASRAMPIATWLVALMGAGMCVQATQLLIQADWIHVSESLWDTSGQLPENSLLGQLLYAMLGYEATPSAEEALVYLGSLMMITGAIIAGYYVGQKKSGVAV